MSATQPPVDIPDSQIEPIILNGLQGRLLTLESAKSDTIILIQGHHTAHERAYSIAQLLQEYGAVQSPDLPGFGGMDSFYRVGLKPSYDAYADYLYTFLQSRKLTQQITIFSISFGAQVVTRMLQKYPDSQSWVKHCIGFVALGGKNDFAMQPLYKYAIYGIAYSGSTRFGAAMYRNIVFNKFSLGALMRIFSLAKGKMQSDDSSLRREMVQMEQYLWEVGDEQTHAVTTLSMFNDTLTKYSDSPIDLTFHNIITDSDQYLNSESVANTMGKLYSGYVAHNFDSSVHMPSMIASKEQLRHMIPKSIQKLLEGA